MVLLRLHKLKLDIKLKQVFIGKGSTRKPKRFILFSDSSAGDVKIPDTFHREKIAEEIARTILSSDGQMNFLVSGEWGIGKTSILNLISKNIKQKGIKFIWFSPWKYSGSKEEANAISRVFLTVLAQNLGKSIILRDLYIKRQIENDRNLITQLITLVQLIFVYLLYLGVIFLILLLINPIVLNFVSYAKFLPPLEKILNIIGEENNLGIISAILALPPLGQYFLSKIIEKGETEKISSPELFENVFSSLVERSVSIRWIQEMASFWEEVVSKTWLSFLGTPLTNLLYSISVFKIKKLIIFVDDLDRCDVLEIQEFLTGMKTFLDHKNVYYVIAADKSKLGDIDFLRKIVQIDWNVPFLTKDQILFYLNSLLNEAGAIAELKSDVEEIKSILMLYPNPRRIKYYLRRLLFELNIEKAKIS